MKRLREAKVTPKKFAYHFCLEYDRTSLEKKSIKDIIVELARHGFGSGMIDAPNREDFIMVLDGLDLSTNQKDDIINFAKAAAVEIRKQKPNIKDSWIIAGLLNYYGYVSDGQLERANRFARSKGMELINSDRYEDIEKIWPGVKQYRESWDPTLDNMTFEDELATYDATPVTPMEFDAAELYGDATESPIWTPDSDISWMGVPEELDPLAGEVAPLYESKKLQEKCDREVWSFAIALIKGGLNEHEVLEALLKKFSNEVSKDDIINSWQHANCDYDDGSWKEKEHAFWGDQLDEDSNFHDEVWDYAQILMEENYPKYVVLQMCMNDFADKYPTDDISDTVDEVFRNKRIKRFREGKINDFYLDKIYDPCLGRPGKNGFDSVGRALFGGPLDSLEDFIDDAKVNPGWNSKNKAKRAAVNAQWARNPHSEESEAFQRAYGRYRDYLDQKQKDKEAKSRARNERWANGTQTLGDKVASGLRLDADDYKVMPGSDDTRWAREKKVKDRVKFGRGTLADEFVDIKAKNEKDENGGQLELFESILKEGGKRKNMPQTTIDTFIHQLLLVEDPARRQSIVDEIFKAIAEENTARALKAQPKIQESFNDGQLAYGIKAHFRNNREATARDDLKRKHYDLVLTYGKQKYIKEDYGYYEGGWTQNNFSSSQQRYTLVCENDNDDEYGRWTGQTVDSQCIPWIDNRLKQYIEKSNFFNSFANECTYKQMMKWNEEDEET